MIFVIPFYAFALPQNHYMDFFIIANLFCISFGLGMRKTQD
jgi:hypothetical protein